MKWYNKTRTTFIDLSKVSYWDYTSREEIIKTLQRIQRTIGDAISAKSYILIVVDGCERDFSGEEADEIYNILKTQKDVI